MKYVFEHHLNGVYFEIKINEEKMLISAGNEKLGMVLWEMPENTISKTAEFVPKNSLDAVLRTLCLLIGMSLHNVMGTVCSPTSMLRLLELQKETTSKMMAFIDELEKKSKSDPGQNN